MSCDTISTQHVCVRMCECMCEKGGRVAVWGLSVVGVSYRGKEEGGLPSLC